MPDNRQLEEWARVAALHGAETRPPLPGEKVGAALNVRQGLWPLNGLRHSPAADTCGGYIWAGEEFSTDDDFFKPVHLEHLREWCPSAVPYLGLAPGWRFLIAPGHEDVWFDASLLGR